MAANAFQIPHFKAFVLRCLLMFADVNSIKYF